MDDDRITLADIESKIRGVQARAGKPLSTVRPVFPGVAGVALGLLVAAAFLFGYRRGKNSSSVIEITRI